MDVPTLSSFLRPIPTVKHVFFHYQEGSLVDHQALGPPALQLVLDPLAVTFLDNRLYISVRQAANS